MSSDSPLAALFEHKLPRFWVLLIAAAAFVLGYRQHVAAAGGVALRPRRHADGFMARGDYLSFMLIGVVAIPLLIVMPQRFVETMPPRLINVPNRDYWLCA